MLTNHGSRHVKKIVALTTLACFFVSSIAGQALAALLVPGPETRRPAQVIDGTELPATAGRITGGRYFGGKTIVVNIQDLHCHGEVQKNISRLLRFLDEKYGLGSVYLEGAAGEIDTSWLNGIADPKLRDDIASSLVREGKLTGTEYYAIASGKTKLLRGIENRELYRDNAVRLRRILEADGEIRNLLEQVRLELAPLAKATLGGQNRRLEEANAEYAQGKLNGGKYYGLLQKYAAKCGIPAGAYPNLEGYLAVTKKAKELRYKRIARELQSYIASLKNTLPYNVYSRLMKDTANFSDTDELYSALLKLSKDRSFSVPPEYRNLSEYFAYLDAYRRINPVNLVREEKGLLAEIENRLAANRGEREVLFLLSYVRYLEAYCTNKISAEDYDYYTAHYAEFVSLWDKYLDSETLSLLAPYQETLKAFYAGNLERNHWFLKNVAGDLPAAVSRGTVPPGDALETARHLAGTSDIRVVVTGGFHTQGFTQLLEEQRISYLIVTPNVTQDTAGAEAVYVRLAKEQVAMLTSAFAMLVYSQHTQSYIAANLVRETVSALIARGLDKGEIERNVNGLLQHFKTQYAASFAGRELAFRLDSVRDKENFTYHVIIDGREEAGVVENGRLKGETARAADDLDAAKLASFVRGTFGENSAVYRNYEEIAPGLEAMVDVLRNSGSLLKPSLSSQKGSADIRTVSLLGLTAATIVFLPYVSAQGMFAAAALIAGIVAAVKIFAESLNGTRLGAMLATVTGPGGVSFPGGYTQVPSTQPRQNGTPTVKEARKDTFEKSKAAELMGLVTAGKQEEAIRFYEANRLEIDLSLLPPEIAAFVVRAPADPDFKKSQELKAYSRRYSENIKNRVQPVEKSNKTDNKNRDGYICQGDDAQRAFWQHPEQYVKGDVTGQYRDRVLSLIDLCLARGAELGLNAETVAAIEAQRQGLADGYSQIHSFESVVKSREDFFLGHNYLEEGIMFVAGDVTAKLDAISPTSCDEYLLHEVLCPIVGHTASILLQQKLFPAHYRHADLTTQDPDKPAKGLLGGMLRRMIDYKNLSALEGTGPHTTTGDVRDAIDSLQRLTQVLKEKGFASLVKRSEASLEREIKTVAAEINLLSGRNVVLLAGPSSSNKTSVAGRIQNEVAGGRVVTLSLDNYYKDHADVPRKNGKLDFDNPKALDLDRLNRDIQRLLAGEKVDTPVFNFKTGKREAASVTLQLGENQILFIEGIFALHQSVVKDIDPKKVFCVGIKPTADVRLASGDRVSSADLRLVRRMVRDFNFRGYSPVNTMQQWQMVAEGEQEFIHPSLKRADYIVNSFMPYELSALKLFAVPLLAQAKGEAAQANNRGVLEQVARLEKVFSEVPDIDRSLLSAIPANSTIREFIGAEPAAETTATMQQAAAQALGSNSAAVVAALEATNPLLARFLAEPSVGRAVLLYKRGMLKKNNDILSGMMKGSLSAALRERGAELGIPAGKQARLSLYTIASDALPATGEAYLLATMGLKLQAGGRVSIVFADHNLLREYLLDCMITNNGPPSYASVAEMVTELVAHEADEYIALNRPSTQLAAAFTRYLAREVLGVSDPAAAGEDRLQEARTSDNFHAFIRSLAAKAADGSLEQYCAAEDLGYARAQALAKQVRLLDIAAQLYGDSRIMAEALAQAQEAAKERSLFSARVGAVVTINGRIVGRGFNRMAHQLHAEQLSLFDACEHVAAELPDTDPRRAQALAKIDSMKIASQRFVDPEQYAQLFLDTGTGFKELFDLLDIDPKTISLYVTLAPCNKCARMMKEMGIGRVVFAARSANPTHAGVQALRDAGVDIDGGVMVDAGERATWGYIFAARRFPRLYALSQDIGRALRTARQKRAGTYEAEPAQTVDTEQGELGRAVEEAVRETTEKLPFADLLIPERRAPSEVYAGTAEGTAVEPAFLRYARNELFVNEPLLRRLFDEHVTVVVLKDAVVLNLKRDLLSKQETLRLSRDISKEEAYLRVRHFLREARRLRVQEDVHFSSLFYRASVRPTIFNPLFNPETQNGYLVDMLLKKRAKGEKHVKVWSCGAAAGMELRTLIWLVSQAQAAVDRRLGSPEDWSSWRFEFYGTDEEKHMLKLAENHQGADYMQVGASPDDVAPVYADARHLQPEYISLNHIEIAQVRQWAGWHGKDGFDVVMQLNTPHVKECQQIIDGLINEGGFFGYGNLLWIKERSGKAARQATEEEIKAAQEPVALPSEDVVDDPEIERLLGAELRDSFVEINRGNPLRVVKIGENATPEELEQQLRELPADDLAMIVCEWRSDQVVNHTVVVDKPGYLLWKDKARAIVNGRIDSGEYEYALHLQAYPAQRKVELITLTLGRDYADRLRNRGKMSSTFRKFVRMLERKYYHWEIEGIAESPIVEYWCEKYFAAARLSHNRYLGTIGERQTADRQEREKLLLDESDWDEWQRDLLDECVKTRVDLRRADKDENGRLVRDALRTLSEVTAEEGAEFGAYAESLSLIDRCILKDKDVSIALFEPTEDLASRLINRYNFRDVLIVDPETKTIYIDKSFWQRAILDKGAKELKERRMHVRIAALLARAAKSLEYIDAMPANAPFKKDDESAMKRVTDLYVTEHFGLALTRSMSEFITADPSIGKKEWYLKSIGSRAPPVRAFLSAIRDTRFFTAIYELIARNAFFLRLYDALNKRDFERIPLKRIGQGLTQLSQQLEGQPLTEPARYRAAVTSLGRDLDRLTAAMAGAAYLRAESGKDVLGYSGEYRKVVTDQLDIVGLAQLLVHLRDVYGRKDIDPQELATDIRQLKLKLDLYAASFAELQTHIRNKVSDTSSQTYERNGLFRNHAKPEDMIYGDTSQEPGFYGALEKELRSGRDRTHYIWAMGGGADVLSAVKHWKELDSFYQSVRREHERLTFGQALQLLPTALSHWDKWVEFYESKTEQADGPRRFPGIAKILFYDLAHWKEVFLFFTGRKPCGKLDIVIVASAEKRIGYVDPAAVKEEKGREYASFESWKKEQNPLYVKQSEVISYERGRHTRVVFKRRMPGVIGKDEMDGIEEIGCGNVVRATKDVNVRGAAKNLDEAYVIQGLQKKGLNIPIYMVSINGTLDATAGDMAQFIGKTRVPGASISMELYEHGGDAIADMHAGNKDTIVSPNNEKFATKVLPLLKERVPEFSAYFTLSGLGNDFESYHKWINEVLRHLLKTGVISEIVPPWMAGTKEGAALAQEAAGTKVTSYANKRGLAQITDRNFYNALYDFFRFLDRHSFLRSFLRQPLRLIFRAGNETNLFASFVGYSREGQARRRGDFHGSLSFEQRGEIAKYTFVMPFDKFAAAMDNRGEITIDILSSGLYNAQEKKDFAEKLAIGRSAAQRDLTIEKISEVYRRLGITTEEGKLALEIRAAAASGAQTQYPSERVLDYEYPGIEQADVPSVPAVGSRTEEPEGRLISRPEQEPKKDGTPRALGFNIGYLYQGITKSDPLFAEFLVRPTVELAKQLAGRGLLAKNEGMLTDLIKKSVGQAVRARAAEMGLEKGARVTVQNYTLSSSDLIEDASGCLLATMGVETGPDNKKATIIFSDHQLFREYLLSTVVNNNGPPSFDMLEEMVGIIVAHECDEYIAIEKPYSTLGLAFTRYIAGTLLKMPSDKYTPQELTALTAEFRTADNFHEYIRHLQQRAADGTLEQYAAQTALPLDRLRTLVQQGKLLDVVEQVWLKEYYALAEQLLSGADLEYFRKVDRYYTELDWDKHFEQIKEIGKVFAKGPMVYEVFGLGFPFYGKVDIRKRMYRELLNLRNHKVDLQKFRLRLLPDLDVLLINNPSDEGPWTLRPYMDIDAANTFAAEMGYYMRQWKEIFKELSERFNLRNSASDGDGRAIEADFMEKDRLHVDINPMPLHIWNNLPAFAKMEDMKNFHVIQDLLFTTVYLSESQWKDSRYPVDVPLKFRQNFVLNLLKDHGGISLAKLIDTIYEVQPHTNVLKMYSASRTLIAERFQAAIERARAEGLIRDRRGILTLSKKGEAFLERVDQHRKRLIRESFEDLKYDEDKILRDLGTEYDEPAEEETAVHAMDLAAGPLAGLSQAAQELSITIAEGDDTSAAVRRETKSLAARYRLTERLAGPAALREAFEDIAENFGGKCAWSLITEQLRERIGFRKPPSRYIGISDGWLAFIEANRKLVDEGNALVKEDLRTFGRVRPETLSLLRSRIRGFSFPAAVQERVAKAAKDLKGPVIARSSGRWEDSFTRNLAGVFTSQKRAGRKLAPQAVREVYLQAIETIWLRQNGEDRIDGVPNLLSAEEGIAIELQPFKKFQASGVAMSNYYGHTSIEAVLGDASYAVKAEHANMTRFLFPKDGSGKMEYNTSFLKTPYEFSLKGKEYSVSDRNTDKMRQVLAKCPRIDGKLSFLSEEQARELDRVVNEIEEAVGVPVDVEWGFENVTDREPYIIQVRPIIGGFNQPLAKMDGALAARAPIAGTTIALGATPSRGFTGKMVLFGNNTDRAVVEQFEKEYGNEYIRVQHDVASAVHGGGATKARVLVDVSAGTVQAHNINFITGRIAKGEFTYASGPVLREDLGSRLDFVAHPSLKGVWISKQDVTYFSDGLNGSFFAEPAAPQAAASLNERQRALAWFGDSMEGKWSDAGFSPESVTGKMYQELLEEALSNPLNPPDWESPAMAKLDRAVNRAGEREAGAAAAKARAAGPKKVLGRKMRILIVNDLPMMLKAHSFLLNRTLGLDGSSNYAVSFAGSFGEARRILEESAAPYDYIISDWQLGDRMTGKDLMVVAVARGVKRFSVDSAMPEDGEKLLNDKRYSRLKQLLRIDFNDFGYTPEKMVEYIRDYYEELTEREGTVVEKADRERVVFVVSSRDLAEAQELAQVISRSSLVGCRAVTAGSLAELERLLADYRPACIIADPVLDGRDVSDRILAIARDNGGAKCVFTSEDAAGLPKSFASKEGVLGVVEKPFHFDETLRLVANDATVSGDAVIPLTGMQDFSKKIMVGDEFRVEPALGLKALRYAEIHNRLVELAGKEKAEINERGRAFVIRALRGSLERRGRFPVRLVFVDDNDPHLAGGALASFIDNTVYFRSSASVYDLLAYFLHESSHLLTDNEVFPVKAEGRVIRSALAMAAALRDAAETDESYRADLAKLADTVEYVALQSRLRIVTGALQQSAYGDQWLAKNGLGRLAHAGSAYLDGMAEAYDDVEGTAIAADPAFAASLKNLLAQRPSSDRLEFLVLRSLVRTQRSQFNGIMDRVNEVIDQWTRNDALTYAGSWQFMEGYAGRKDLASLQSWCRSELSRLKGAERKALEERIVAYLFDFMQVNLEPSLTTFQLSGVLSRKQANCLSGSLLFAHLAEAFGINAGLVNVAKDREGNALMHVCNLITYGDGSRRLLDLQSHSTADPAPQSIVGRDAAGTYRAFSREEYLTGKVASLTKTDVEAMLHGWSGFYYREKGDILRAVEEFKQALLLNPEEPSVHNSLGIAYRLLAESTDGTYLQSALLEFTAAVIAAEKTDMAIVQIYALCHLAAIFAQNELPERAETARAWARRVLSERIRNSWLSGLSDTYLQFLSDKLGGYYVDLLRNDNADALPQGRRTVLLHPEEYEGPEPTAEEIQRILEENPELAAILNPYAAQPVKEPARQTAEQAAPAAKAVPAATPVQAARPAQTVVVEEPLTGDFAARRSGNRFFIEAAALGRLEGSNAAFYVTLSGELCIYPDVQSLVRKIRTLPLTRVQKRALELRLARAIYPVRIDAANGCVELDRTLAKHPALEGRTFKLVGAGDHYLCLSDQEFRTYALNQETIGVMIDNLASRIGEPGREGKISNELVPQFLAVLDQHRSDRSFVRAFAAALAQLRADERCRKDTAVYDLVAFLQTALDILTASDRRLDAFSQEKQVPAGLDVLKESRKDFMRVLFYQKALETLRDRFAGEDSRKAVVQELLTVLQMPEDGTERFTPGEMPTGLPSASLPVVDREKVQKVIEYFFENPDRYSDTDIIVGRPLTPEIVTALESLLGELRAAVPEELLYLQEPEQCHVTVGVKTRALFREAHRPSEKDWADAQNMVRVPAFASTLKGTLKLMPDGVIIYEITDPTICEMFKRLRGEMPASWSKPFIVHMTIGRFRKLTFTDADIARIQQVLQRYNDAQALAKPVNIDSLKFGSVTSMGEEEFFVRPLRLAGAAPVAMKETPGVAELIRDATLRNPLTNPGFSRRIGDGIVEGIVPEQRQWLTENAPELAGGRAVIRVQRSFTPDEKAQVRVLRQMGIPALAVTLWDQAVPPADGYVCSVTVPVADRRETAKVYSIDGIIYLYYPKAELSGLSAEETELVRQLLLGRGALTLVDEMKEREKVFVQVRRKKISPLSADAVRRARVQGMVWSGGRVVNLKKVLLGSDARFIPSQVLTDVPFAMPAAVDSENDALRYSGALSELAVTFAPRAGDTQWFGRELFEKYRLNAGRLGDIAADTRVDLLKFGIAMADTVVGNGELRKLYPWLEGLDKELPAGLGAEETVKEMVLRVFAPLAIARRQQTAPELKTNVTVSLPLFSLRRSGNFTGCGEITDLKRFAGSKAFNQVLLLPFLRPAKGKGRFSPFEPISRQAVFEAYVDLIDGAERLGITGAAKDAIVNDLLAPQGTEKVDYEAVLARKLPVARREYAAFAERKSGQWENFQSFVEEQKSWLDEYAGYMALATLLGEEPARCERGRGEALQKQIELDAGKRKEYEEVKNSFLLLQWLANEQFKDVLAAYHAQGSRLLFDTPMFLSADSVTRYYHPEYFRDGHPASARQGANLASWNWNALKVEDYRFLIDPSTRWLRLGFDGVRKDDFQSVYDTKADVDAPGDEFVRKLVDAERRAKRKEPVVIAEAGDMAAHVREFYRFLSTGDLRQLKPGARLRENLQLEITSHDTLRFFEEASYTGNFGAKRDIPSFLRLVKDAFNTGVQDVAFAYGDQFGDNWNIKYADAADRDNPFWTYLEPEYTDRERRPFDSLEVFRQIGRLREVLLPKIPEARYRQGFFAGSAIFADVVADKAAAAGLARPVAIDLRYNDGKDVLETVSGEGLGAFVKCYERIRASGEKGQSALAYHASSGDLMKAAYGVVRPLAQAKGADQKYFKALLARMEKLDLQVRATNDNEEKKGLTIALFGLLDGAAKTLAENAKKEEERLLNANMKTALDEALKAANVNVESTRGFGRSS